MVKGTGKCFDMKDGVEIETVVVLRNEGVEVEERSAPGDLVLGTLV